LVILFVLSSVVRANDLIITADRKLDKEGRVWMLSYFPEREDFCLRTFRNEIQVEEECYGMPVIGEQIDVVEWKGLKVLSIIVADELTFDVRYLHNYFRKEYGSFRITLLEEETGWEWYIPHVQDILKGVHFIANTRVGVPIGTKVRMIYGIQ
jgi:hypothetical protein